MSWRPTQATRSPIEHPAGTLGMNNKHVLDGMSRAYRAALQLAEDGHEILSIQTCWRKPVIYVEPSPLCELLTAGTKMRRLVPSDPFKRHVHIKVADYDGCQVQWRVVK